MTSPPVERLSVAQARRIALAAQGFATARPSTPGPRHVLGVVDRLGVVQIDSVNVLARAHYLPAFSRLGPYDRGQLDRATGTSPHRLVEYWAHEASLVRPATHRLLRWRMARWREGMSHRVRWAAEHPEVLDAVRGAVKAHGPATAVRLEAVLAADAPRSSRDWWNNWSPVRKALELLFRAGEVTSAGRTPQFERRYALPELVLPSAVVDAPDPAEPEAFAALIGIAARACGVATERDLRDYFRLDRINARTGIELLAERGELVPATIEGLRRPAWLHRDARRPRTVAARALIAPFDPLIWQRDRVEELFGVRYRIEIYVPAPRRQYGYYVLPFLLGDRIAARVDLKADRRAGVLRVQAAHAEPDAPGETASALAEELALLARWLDLDGVTVAERGDLAAALARCAAGQATSSIRLPSGSATTHS
ncbi:MAG: winged helix DNA-binding domain-containing protein [Dactylosporangium sp.]|nr:winged helix DNA-binding domain-containing protein [Dactylosporangium sp.]